jgi:hypothetical protein
VSTDNVEMPGAIPVVPASNFQNKHTAKAWAFPLENDVRTLVPEAEEVGQPSRSDQLCRFTT